MQFDNNPTFILYEKAYTGEGFHTTEVNGYFEAHKLLNDTNVFLGGSSYLYMKDAYHKEVLIWSAHLVNESEFSFNYDTCDLAQVVKNVFGSLDNYFQESSIDISNKKLTQKENTDIEHTILSALEQSDIIIKNNYKPNSNKF